MDFSHKIEDNIGIFTLSGTLLGENDGMPLADDFNDLMEEGVKTFILDLGELKHINSSGLGVFITLLTRARKKDGELLLVNPSDHIRNLMIITKLHSIFQIFDNLEDALASLKSTEE